ncbi:DUF262 domain-containing protein [Helicobacter cetorum]|uniref:DUF262 domain-containing protein n=1 Tax=Helicobacter cetorum TaxID=138563 RepID=UPI000CF084BD|nr:DUF262 domain-containing protein [Helicobacter cetorum]
MSSLMTLKEVLRMGAFRIAHYQRGYAWEDEQLEDFWDDLESLDNTQIHSLNMLTLQRRSDLDSNQRLDEKILSDVVTFEVIDGQQRLTTSVILISVFLKNIKNSNLDKDTYISKEELCKEENGGKYYVFGYSNDKDSFDALEKIIHNEKTSRVKSVYTKNLFNAQKFFGKKIKNLPTDKKRDLFKLLLNNMAFNVYEISEKLDVLTTFETINNRGKRLSSLELLKNRLHFLAPKVTNNKI